MFSGIWKSIAVRSMAAMSVIAGSAYADLRVVAIDCLDSSTWEVTLLPDEELVELDTVNCVCESDDWQVQRYLELYGKEYMRRAVERGRPVTDSQQRATEVEKVISQFPALGKPHVPSVLGGTRLPDGTQIDTGVTTIWCYTTDQITSYLEQIDEALGKALR